MAQPVRVISTADSPVSQEPRALVGTPNPTERPERNSTTPFLQSPHHHPNFNPTKSRGAASSEGCLPKPPKPSKKPRMPYVQYCRILGKVLGKGTATISAPKVKDVLTQEGNLYSDSIHNSKKQPSIKRSRLKLLESEKVKEDSVFKQPSGRTASSAPLQMEDYNMTTHTFRVTRRGNADEVTALTDLQDSVFKQPSGRTASSAPLQMEDYNMTTHTFRVTRRGNADEVTALTDLQGQAIVTGSEDNHVEDDGSYFQRFSSKDAFKSMTDPNTMLATLRYFEKARVTTAYSGAHFKPAFDWGAVDRNTFAKCLLTLCQQVKESFAGEPRLLKLRSPCYILGDIHSSYCDLLTFEKMLWRIGPNLTATSFLFLGNYVDRGDYGIEVVSYLFAQKLLAPDKFYLLRGTHELRSVQKKYNFESECLGKFGKELGLQIWEAVNECFDVMPIAATLDDKVFCVHGGIPNPENGGVDIEAINTIPSPLSDPKVESPLAWELLWSGSLSHTDKTTPENEGQNPGGKTSTLHNSSDETMKDRIQELSENNGFTFNTQRSTAHFFSRDAVCGFLDRNDLPNVIGAHELQEVGFKVQQQGKLLTFSSSRYCWSSSDLVCVFADNCKFHLIRIKRD